jgi:hypothetical protein
MTSTLQQARIQNVLSWVSRARQPRVEGYEGDRKCTGMTSTLQVADVRMKSMVQLQVEVQEELKKKLNGQSR